MRILPTKRWKTFLLAGESYLAGAPLHWCRQNHIWKFAKYWDGQQHIQFSILTDCTLRYITCLVCNRWKLITFHRFGRPEEMGGIVSFLVSDEVDFVLQLNIDGIQTQYQNQYQIWQYFPSHQASYLTGENIVLAGGMNARLWYSLTCCWKWC